MMDLRTRIQRWPVRCAAVLAISSTTSALSLANFQLITSNSISTTCILGYNSDIFGCSASDFTNGNRCSAQCIEGLRRTATIVGTFCEGEQVNSETLLGITLMGQLVDTLCPGAGVVTPTADPTTNGGGGFTTLTGELTTATFTSTRTTSQQQPTTSSDTTRTTEIQPTRTQTSNDGAPTTTEQPTLQPTEDAPDPTISDPPETEAPAPTDEGQDASSTTEELEPAFTNNGSPFLDFRPSTGTYVHPSLSHVLFSAALLAVLLGE